MNHLILTLAIWLTSSSDADALRRTSPAYLDAPTAHAHLAAARVAGVVHRVDPDLLLAIAWRESRYQPAAVGPLVRGRRACGVMQPIMRERCAAPSLLDGYLEGAQHLRGWVRATRDRHLALVGYAGGYAMIAKCKLGPIVRERAGGAVDLCSVPELRRAAWIRRERERSTRQLAVW